MKRDVLLRGLRALLDSGSLLPDDHAFVSEAYTAIAGKTPQRDIVERLVSLGVDARTEVTLPSASPRSRSGTFRADIAVFVDGKIVALCECKSTPRELTGRQREHYAGSGLPWFVAGWSNLEAAVRELAKAAGAEVG